MSRYLSPKATQPPLATSSAEELNGDANLRVLLAKNSKRMKKSKKNLSGNATGFRVSMQHLDRKQQREKQLQEIAKYRRDTIALKMQFHDEIQKQMEATFKQIHKA